MRIKPRTIPIVTLSSIIIASVLALTIFSFYVYLGWKEKNIERKYRISLQDLNAQLFRKYIMLDVQARIGSEEGFKNWPLVCGTIKNKSNKKIYSLKLKVSFSDPEGRVLYVDSFYPVGPKVRALIDMGNITKSFLLEGDSVSFNHQLTNCPTVVSEYLRSKLKFAKEGDTVPLTLKYSLETLDIK